MGCCASVSAEQEVPIKVTNGVKVKDVGNYKLPPTATWPDGEPAARGSWLYCPPNKTGKPMPAVVVVHGSCSENGVGQLVFDIVGNSADVGRDLDLFWTGLEDVAQAISEQGFVVLMVGMPDHDEKNYPEKIKSGGMTNGWPAVDYARFLSAAIDHMIAVAPKHHTGLMLAVASRLPSAADEVAKLASIWGGDATARQQYWEPSTTPS